MHDDVILGGESSPGGEARCRGLGATVPEDVVGNERLAQRGGERGMDA